MGRVFLKWLRTGFGVLTLGVDQLRSSRKSSRYQAGCFLLGGIFVAGCGLQYIDRASPSEEAYWSKPGYTMAMTREFLYKECGYGDKNWRSYDEFKEYLVRYQVCMLENGFSYMEDAYDVTSLGFGPLSKGLCRTQEDYDQYPACRSIMRKKK